MNTLFDEVKNNKKKRDVNIQNFRHFLIEFTVSVIM